MRRSIFRALAAALLVAGCAGAQPSPAGATPEHGAWQLVSLAGRPVASRDQREPRLILEAATHTAAGYGGCNRFTGSYTLDGESLAFGPLASTRMACVDGMDVEQAFHAALSRTARWRVSGGKLELLDAAGSVLAQLEPRPAK